ncbi:hypothetical protein ACHAWX_000248 [Stephanocyclus meneghinianus]
MNPEADSTNNGRIASPIPTQQPDAGKAIDESHLVKLSASRESEATAPVSPCLSELYLVSPPRRNTSNISSNHAPSMRASLTPPPHSEKINRAIRTAEFQLDAAVYDVHRYISQGCSDSDRGDMARDFTGSPESEYSDDLLSPRVLPDFASPMTVDIDNESSDSFSRMSYRRRILDDGDKKDIDVESRYSNINDPKDVMRKIHSDSNYCSSMENENPNVSDDAFEENKNNQRGEDVRDIKSDKDKRLNIRADSSVSVDITNHDHSETMELRTLQLVEGKFQVWPPLRSSGLLSFA